MSFTLQQYLLTFVKFCLACIVWPLYVVLMIVWLLIVEPVCYIIEKVNNE